jgi:hypothetical protein
MCISVVTSHDVLLQRNTFLCVKRVTMSVRFVHRVVHTVTWNVINVTRVIITE